jgi:SM-20-related protein
MAVIFGQKIAVTLLLKEGYRRCVTLGANDPSLISLLEVIATRNDEKARPIVFNLELENAEGSLFFAASDLVALSTNPAISVGLQNVSSDIEFSHVVKQNYLSNKLLASLLKFVEEQAKEFKLHASRLKTRKLILYNLGGFEETFRERVRSDLPAVLEQLQIPDFPISEIEYQVASYNNGHYSTRHYDLHPSQGSRIVTFVYYFHNEPRSFEGGSLRLYKGKLENGNYTCGEATVDLDPANNTMLFFPSACYHEVLPVKCWSGKFRDSRFALVGCVRMS